MHLLTYASRALQTIFTTNGRRGKLRELKFGKKTFSVCFFIKNIMGVDFNKSGQDAAFYKITSIKNTAKK